MKRQQKREYDTKIYTFYGTCSCCIQRYKRTESVCLPVVYCSSVGGILPYMVSSAGSTGYDWRHGGGAYIAFDNMGKPWECRNGRWIDGYGKWDFFRISKKCSVVDDSTGTVWTGSTVFNHNKKKGEKLPDTVFAFFICGVSGFALMKEIDASMTIEAAVILSLFLILFSAAIRTGIVMYQETKQYAEKIRNESEPDTVNKFYYMTQLDGYLGDGTDEKEE